MKKDLSIDNQNISIFSYNVFWKIMTNKNSPLVNTLGQKKIYELKSNILTNIEYVISYYNPFVYCFQEIESENDILQKFNKNKFMYHIGCSIPEHILTIWRKDVLEKKLILDGEFEKGRPFTIIIFKDLRFDIYWMLINIHGSHNYNTEIEIFKPIQNLIDINKNKIKKYDIKRLIMIGDFNRDISSQIELSPSNYKIKINSVEHIFNYLKNNNKTCCSLKGWGHKYNFDQAIDTYGKPLGIFQLNKEKWYKSESSDHIPIMAIFKNLM